MNAVDTRRRVGHFSLSLILVFIAILLFVLAEFVAQGWLTKGTFPEWLAAGFVALAAAEVPW